MLDKKSRIYSDRPVLIMAGQLLGWDKGPALIPFCQTWSEYRRLFAQIMGTRSKIDSFNELFTDETHTFLRNVLETPNSWLDHSRRYAGALVLQVAFGYKAKEKDDHLVELVDEAMDNFSETTASNAFMVDVFPSMQYIPAWFPGAEWKRKSIKYQKTLQEMLEVPFLWVKQQMAAGTASNCFVSRQLEAKSLTAEEETTIKWAAAGIYSGGADTTVAHIECFFLAMTLHVESQKKAQAEMESVLGVGVLPTLADRGRLPYFEALFTEVYRCYTLAPTGLPHVCTQDDIHDGYFIPKGSIIFSNVWQFLHDPKTYSNPDKFSPERFLETPGHPKEKDPKDYVFGFGRRSCPGMHFADASMWILLASLVAGFDIRPPVKDGKPILPSGKFADGSIRPFQSTEAAPAPLFTPDRITPVDQKTFNENYGGSLICCQVMLVLYGLAVLQTYMYFMKYAKDSIAMKALVFFVWSMATVHAFFVCHTVYHYSILTYTRPLWIIDGEWSVYAATSVGVVLCFCIQTFFGRMLFLLTKGKLRWFITPVLAALVLGQVAFGIYLSYRMFSIWSLVNIHEMVYDAMVPLFVIRVASDTLTSVALCYVLFDSRTSFGKSRELIKTLIIYAMERFVLTTLVVLVQTIILVARPESIWAMVIEFVTAQLYTNSFLATLNSRNHLRGIGANGDSKYITSSNGGLRSNIDTRPGVQVMNINGNNRPFDVKYANGVRIGTETLVMTDMGDKQSV
ncbi:hypothetical protein D9758_005187 [Tetrapyrgos nigripes]|uniref:DUF6534 domain-containing protein n=1 Tax=Tetrapyrgos nigripes TaxID=182062 RepID=A0A8H5GWR0_9AGAR|nr:hypothetical protein D9758_005187 [Tetrapyrgos nigripes]